MKLNYYWQFLIIVESKVIIVYILINPDKNRRNKESI